MLKVENGDQCPMCTLYTRREMAPLGLDGGWYREDDSKGGELTICDHVIPDELEHSLVVSIIEVKRELQDLEWSLFLIQRAKGKKNG